LLPCDFIDQSLFPLKSATDIEWPNRDFRRHAGPERCIARPHFEGVELQGKCRQRQLQIIELFGSRVVAMTRGAVACGSMGANIH